MNSMYYKEHDVGSLSPGPGPWWSGLVTQSTYEESKGRLKHLSMENCEEHLMPIAPKPARGADQLAAKGNMTHFNVFPGDCKNSSKGQKPVQVHTAFSMQSAPPEYGFGQPAMICGKYPYGDQFYGLLAAYGPQITGRIMLPLNLTNDDGPIFVNAKQYHGIIRRRRSRAKAEMAKKVLKSRKPYLHLSRHLHAMRRPRGCGGRFLNTKETEKGKSRNLDAKNTEHPTGSQRSEVLQSDNGTRSHISGSEVTSMFSMGDLNHFPIGSLSVASLSDMMMSGATVHSLGMHGFAAAASGGNRCNLAA